MLLEGFHHIIQIRIILLQPNEFDQVTMRCGMDNLCLRVDVGDGELGVEVVDVPHLLLHVSNNN